MELKAKEKKNIILNLIKNKFKVSPVIKVRKIIGEITKVKEA